MEGVGAVNAFLQFYFAVAAKASETLGSMWCFAGGQLQGLRRCIKHAGADRTGELSARR